MKLLVSLFFYLSLVTSSENIMEEFHLLSSEKDEKLFVEKYKNDTSPTIQGYVCAVEMKQAEYVFNPITKLKIFNTSKKKLDSLVFENPTNLDLRYIRLLLQERTPSILGYNDFIKEDKNILKTKIESRQVSEEFINYIYRNTSL